MFTVEGNGVHSGRGGQQNRVQGIVLAVREIGSDDAGDVAMVVVDDGSIKGEGRA